MLKFKGFQFIGISTRASTLNLGHVLYSKTRMTTFIKTEKSDDQTNIDKYRVAANITGYHIISKLIFLRIIYIIPKFMNIRQLLNLENVSVLIIELFRFSQGTLLLK